MRRLCLALLLASPAALAGELVGVVLVSHDAFVSGAALPDGRVVLAGESAGEGREPWVTDGTPAGTRILRDISPGEASGMPGAFVRVGDDVWFEAGQRLWRTDGTFDGTRPVDGPVAPKVLAAAGGVLYACRPGEVVVAGPDRADPDVLWRVDGATGVATRLLEADRAACGAMAPVGDLLVFAATDAAHGRELWVSDGTPEGTRRLADLRPGEAGSAPRSFVATADAVYFKADAGDGHVAWRTDGTEAGTVRLGGAAAAGVWAPSVGEPFARAGDALYFFSDTDPRALWRSDGTPEGTRPVRSFEGRPGHLVALGARVGFTLGGDAWVSDGSAEGTVPLPAGWGACGSLSVVVDGRWLLTADDGDGCAPWVTDGSSEGAPLLPDGVGLGGLTGSLRVGRSVLLTDWRGHHPVRTLLTDGTRGGTSTLARAAPEDRPPEVAPATEPDRRLALFVADDDARGREPWRRRGARARLLRDLCPGPQGSEPSEPLRVGRAFFFFAEDCEADERALWRTDGTRRGTRRVASPPGEGGGPGGFRFPRPLSFLPDVEGPDSAAVIGDVLYFTAAAGSMGANGVWRTDGTAAGTRRIFFDPVDGATPPADVPDVDELTAAGERLFFVAGPGAHRPPHTRTWGERERALYVSDGEGAVRVETTARFARDLHAVGDHLYFSAWDEAHGFELWTSDGTAAGTRRLTDLAPGPRSAHPRDFAARGEHLDFVADDGTGRAPRSVPLPP